MPLNSDSSAWLLRLLKFNLIKAEHQFFAHTHTHTHPSCVSSREFYIKTFKSGQPAPSGFQEFVKQILKVQLALCSFIFHQDPRPGLISQARLLKAQYVQEISNASDPAFGRLAPFALRGGGTEGPGSFSDRRAYQKPMYLYVFNHQIDFLSRKALTCLCISMFRP